MEDGGISSTRWLLFVMAVSVFFIWRPLQDDAGDLPVRSIFATASDESLYGKGQGRETSFVQARVPILK